ncbi:NUDIX hydrolase [Shimia sp. MMG029]|uniref:NUDIX hydrolase n=1 Tax=Shimia sp. MMG029 TaxID=3021978 RepID=UPI0022FE16F5|nr:NUDIX domain-containing protein [Shimia sp. MMG029]MDA5556065.1 NUDIX domain-containing protein [Shimia sp. MMG029]
MTRDFAHSWRPHNSIRVKALGLHWRENRLLAARVFDDSGKLKGVRPLGGTIEFGETAQNALLREFHEELGITISIANPPIFFENLYEHEGQTGHEYLVIFDVTFPKDCFGKQEEITFSEDNGTLCSAAWFSLEELDLQDGPKLFPEGLKDRLLQGRASLTG